MNKCIDVLLVISLLSLLEVHYKCTYEKNAKNAIQTVKGIMLKWIECKLLHFICSHPFK
jgi:hypothetical protein